MGSAVFNQVGFRIRKDDGSETSATWISGENNNVVFGSAGLNVNFRVRLTVDETGNSKSWSGLAWTLRYSKNGGAYALVTAATPIKISSSSNFTNGDDCTRQLTAPTGSFVTDNNGMQDATGGFSNSGAADNFFETEWCLQLDSTQVTLDDTYDLRIYVGGAAISAYDKTPRISYSNAPPAAPTLEYPSDMATVSTNQPVLGFYSTDPEGDDIEYEVQIDLASSMSSGLSTPESCGWSHEAYWLSNYATAVIAFWAGDGCIYGRFSTPVGMSKINPATGVITQVNQYMTSTTYNLKIWEDSGGDHMYFSGAGSVTVYSWPLPWGSGSSTVIWSGTSGNKCLGIDQNNGNIMFTVVTSVKYWTRSTNTTTDILQFSNPSEIPVDIDINRVNGDIYLVNYWADQVNYSGNVMKWNATTESFDEVEGYSGKMWRFITSDYSGNTWMGNSSGDIYLKPYGKDDFILMSHISGFITVTFDDANNKAYWVKESDKKIYVSNQGALHVFSSPTGYENIDTPSDEAPFISGDTIEFTVPEGYLEGGVTYYWRVRAKDPNGGGSWGSYSSVREFTVENTQRTSLSAYLRGGIIESTSISAFMYSEVNTKSSQKAYVEGFGGKSTSQKAFIQVINPAISSTPAYIEGGWNRSSVPAYIVGYSDAQEIVWTQSNKTWAAYWYIESMGQRYNYSISHFGMSANGKYGVCVPVAHHIVGTETPAWDSPPERWIRTAWKTSDGGANWSSISGIPSNGVDSGTIGPVSISHDGSKAVVGWYTSTGTKGIYYSSDYLSSWTQRFSYRVVGAAISGDGSTIYVVYLDTNYKVSKSTNGGANWTEITPSGGLGDYWSPEIATNYDGSYILLPGRAKGVYLSSNGGTSWGLTDVFGDRHCHSTSMSDSGGIMIMCTYWSSSEDRLYISENYGTSWSYTTIVARAYDSVVESEGNDFYYDVSGNGIYKSWDIGTVFYKIREFQTLPSYCAETGLMAKYGKVFFASRSVLANPGSSTPLRDVTIYIGREVVTTSIHAYLTGPYGLSSLHAYTKGRDVALGSVKAFTRGGVPASSSTPCYVFGNVGVSASIKAFMDGAGEGGDLNSSHSAYLYGSVGVLSNLGAYLIGQITTSIHAFMTTPLPADTSLSAFLYGAISTSISAYTEGELGIVRSSISAYMYGAIATSISAYANGNTLSVSSLSAYICTWEEDVYGKQHAYMIGIERSSVHCFLNGISKNVDYIVLETSDGGATLSKRFLVLQQDYDDGTKETVENVVKTISGGTSKTIGKTYTTWSMIIRVPVETNDERYGTFTDLTYLYSLNDPSGIPSNIITFIDHRGYEYRVMILGRLKQNILTTVVEGSDAVFLCKLQLISV